MCTEFQDHSLRRAILKNLIHNVLPHYVPFFLTTEINAIIEQRIIIKFLVKSGKMNAEICAMLLIVYGAAVIKYSEMYKWIGHVKQGKRFGNG